ncbi:hypothetical protein [Arthrobacter burdickii]|uniref:Secreted protein n=1 Tax=Arthrobacter burdickii TaxID=3035920 RepID=A0ABT8K218_9MICC|nr:hypothetical protein [Arthrobacter burdickii]MDN4611068.1 hypothetical protein [Arthrobacter burdickii]
MNRKLKLGGAAAVALAVFAGGIGVGSAVADPTKSEEYAAVAAESTSRQTLIEEKDAYKDKLLDRQKELEAQLDSARALEGEFRSKEESVAKREQAVGAAEAAVKKREDAVKGAEAKKAATTITEGSWTVGRNVEPGTYTTSAPVTGRCYWGIYVSGTNGDDIVANDNVSGGQPTVTLQVGQDFTTNRCGSWSKIG